MADRQTKKSGREGRGFRPSVSRLLLAAGVILLAIYAVKSIPPPRPGQSSASGSSSAPSLQESSAAEDESRVTPADGENTVYPEGEILLTSARKEYPDGGILLSVPRLGIENMPVLSGDSFSVLANGPGLYDYSCLPGEASNANVSIIAHRDINGKEFYYIDTMREGDMIYLDYGGVRYSYQYSGMTIVRPINLTIVPCTGTARVTLVSCHPIGTTLQRIVVTGDLVSSEYIE